MGKARIVCYTKDYERTYATSFSKAKSRFRNSNMHNDDVQRNGNRNKQGDNVIEFKSKRAKQTEEWKFSLEVFQVNDKNAYTFNIVLPEDNPLDDFSIADILARAAFQVSPHDEGDIDFEPEEGNDGWVVEGEYND